MSLADLTMPSANGDCIWTMRNGDSVAIANIIASGDTKQWQLTVDGDLVFDCAYRFGFGEDQVAALANTTRALLEARGWTLT
jgi:hypothetical protein